MTVAEQINTVIRRVASTGEGHTVALEQTYPTDVADLWDACTNPERLPRWFEPVEGELAEGGRYRLTTSGTSGTIERCDPPGALTLTWEFGGIVSRVLVTITAADGGARLALAHQVADDDHWATYGPAATGIGWDGSLLSLGRLVSGDRGAADFALCGGNLGATEEGREFIAGAARAWGRAHRNAGADQDTATGAAERTARFYRGER